MNRTKKLAGSLVAVLAVLAVGIAPAAQAASTPTSVSVYPPEAHPYGHTYTQWAVLYLKRWLTSPANRVAENDTTGHLCADRQSGPVWFLASDVGGTDVRSCTVPAGKALLVPVAYGECSTLEGNGTTFAALNKCDQGYVAALRAVNITVDGVPMTGLLTSYMFANLLFTFTYTPRRNLFGADVSGTSKSAGNMSFVILKPLAAGRHTVDMSFESYLTPMNGEVVYHLKVRG
jgi:hypothetical protein